MDENPSSRFRIWSSYLAFNVITFFSLVTIEVEDSGKRPRAWARGFSFLSLLVLTIANGAHFHPVYRGIILNTKNELYMIATLLFLWTVLVSVVSSPTTGLAVEDDGAVGLANLYYFTWAGFITSIVLLASYVESAYGISVVASFQNGRNDNRNVDYSKSPSMAFIYWSSLMASSLVVMGTASDIYGRACEVEAEDKEQPFCSRTVFAISSGVMGTICCLLVIAAKMLFMNVPFLGEVGLCAFLFIIYGFELIHATAADGPGSALGNLYYFSWISFFLCFGIGKCLYEDYVDAMEVSENEYEEDNRRTTVPSLARHDVDEDEEEGVVIHNETNVEMHPKNESVQESDVVLKRENERNEVPTKTHDDDDI